jgi:hypothetical protein
VCKNHIKLGPHSLSKETAQHKENLLVIESLFLSFVSLSPDVLLARSFLLTSGQALGPLKRDLIGKKNRRVFVTLPFLVRTKSNYQAVSRKEVHVHHLQILLVVKREKYISHTLGCTGKIKARTKVAGICPVIINHLRVILVNYSRVIYSIHTLTFYKVKGRERHM